jgi:hypothetical protein
MGAVRGVRRPAAVPNSHAGVAMLCSKAGTGIVTGTQSRHDHGSGRVGFGSCWFVESKLLARAQPVTQLGWVGLGYFLVRVKILARARPVARSGRVFLERVGLGLSGRTAHDQV